MLKVLQARLQQKKRTVPFPAEAPVLPSRFRGMPVVDVSRCPEDCRACVQTCPTQAITKKPDGSAAVDLGRCLFCTDCQTACTAKAIAYSQDHSLAARYREDLVVFNGAFLRRGLPEQTVKKIFGRSLKLRQVSAGGCNGCELDINVLTTVVFDLGRFGIEFVASPRHADGLLITGPVTENMQDALQKTYAAVADPKIVIAVGACAISGGPYVDHPEVKNGVVPCSIPVDLFIPGCPPHPLTILDGLLRLIGVISSPS